MRSSIPRSALALLAGPLLVVGACGSDGSEAETASAPEVLQVVDSDLTEYEYMYVIPEGAGTRLDAGEDLTIVPQELNVKVGERIRIVNEDSRGAQVGIFWVPAERTVAMEFTAPGKLTGECDVHPSGEFTINVTEA